MGNGNNQVYICSFDAKDIYLANALKNGNEYGCAITQMDGTPLITRFRNTLDYSLELIKLREIYDKAYHYTSKRSDGVAGFSFTYHGKEYTKHVINVTFKYSVGEFNKVNKYTYVRVGYSIRDVEFNDHVALNEHGEVVGVQIGQEVENEFKNLPEYFSYVIGEDELTGHYEVTKNIPTVMGRDTLREWVYENGFNADGVHYVRYKRSAGSSRVGKCLFINERLYSRIHTWEKCGLTVRNDQKIDLAAWEAYIALTTSSIIGTLSIKPENILVIDDYDSVFTDTVMATRSVNGKLETKPETIEIENSIWDGQSLIDTSLMGEYSKYGMVLLRNRFFKSCCFNTNIQTWFADNGITDVSELNGFTRAERIEDIKLITTPKSIKFVKFGTVDMWLDHLEQEFGVVKHEKKTHYMDGEMVQTHYQLLNTLQLSKDEVQAFLKPSLDYVHALKCDPGLLREHVRMKNYRPSSIIGADNKNDVTLALLNLNDRFPETKVYREFVTQTVKSYISNIKRGHILVDGNYSTLCGNPVEMLLASIGKFDGASELGAGNIHVSRFAYGSELLCSRSPHVTMGNVLLAKNVADEKIDKYFNFTNEICCINSIGDNILSRLSGADFDSDTFLVTDNRILIDAARRNYDKFLVPTCLVTADKAKRYFSNKQKADLDAKTASNLIGEIVNLSQQLNSLFWDQIWNGVSYEDSAGLYADIAQLDTLSMLEIDKAKKVFDIDSKREIAALREKYNLKDETDDKNVRPLFMKHIDKLKGFYVKDAKHYVKHHTTMDYLSEVVDVDTRATRKVNTFGNKGIEYVLDSGLYYKRDVRYDQIGQVFEIVSRCLSKVADIWEADANMFTTKERVMLDDRARYDMVLQLAEIHMNYSTAYRLIQNINMGGNNKRVWNLAFYTLLSIPTSRFYEVFDVYQTKILCANRITGRGDSEFYGRSFAHFYVSGNGNHTRLTDEELVALTFQNVTAHQQNV